MCWSMNMLRHASSAGFRTLIDPVDAPIYLICLSVKPSSIRFNHVQSTYLFTIIYLSVCLPIHPTSYLGTSRYILCRWAGKCRIPLFYSSLLCSSLVWSTLLYSRMNARNIEVSLLINFLWAMECGTVRNGTGFLVKTTCLCDLDHRPQAFNKGWCITYITKLFAEVARTLTFRMKKNLRENILVIALDYNPHHRGKGWISLPHLKDSNYFASIFLSDSGPYKRPFRNKDFLWIPVPVQSIVPLVPQHFP